MMTKGAQRMDGYIRVSRRLGRKGPGYISPSVQREAIERWAEYRAVEIVQWHVDEDESGGTHSRPGLDAARDRALNGETGGIVSWKIDRFSRFTEGGLRDLRLLEDAGARLAFVTEDIDTSGPMGKLVYTMLLAFAEFFLDNIKAGWIVTKTRAVERGAHIARAPFGYRKRDDGTLDVDPQRGPIVTEAFAVAAREGLPATMAFLIDHAPDRTWRTHTVRRFLGTRTYLGLVGYGDLVREDAHDALVTRATFDAANRRIGEIGENTRLPKADFPLSGIAVCASCGGRMVGGRGGNDKRRTYRCADRCDKPMVMSAEPLETIVTDVVREALADVEGRASVEADAREAEVELERAQETLDAAIRAFDGLNEHAAAERLAELRADRDGAQERVDHLGSQRAVVVINASDDWDRLTLDTRRALIRATVDEVRVAPGRGPERVTVKLVSE